MKALLPLALFLAACGATPASPPATPASPPATPEATPPAPSAGATPLTLTRAEWATAQKENRLVEPTFPEVGTPVELMTMEKPPAPKSPTGYVLVTCMPNGGQQWLVREVATGRLLRASATGFVSAPQGVQISATRCTAREYELGKEKVVGTIQIKG